MAAATAKSLAVWAFINKIRDCISVDTIHYIAMYILDGFNFDAVSFFGLQSIESFSNSPIINVSLKQTDMITQIVIYLDYLNLVPN